MNILLTGGTGYIGSHTAISIIKAGHNPVLYDNLSNSNSKIINKISQITGRELTFIEADVRDTDLLVNTLKKYNIDGVIHFAGLKSVSESILNPIEYYDNNVNGSISLIKAMTKVDVNMLIFSSSATVYGNPLYLPLDESHPTSALNPYGQTKLHTEEMLLDLCRSNSNWRVACLRYFNPVGSHSSGQLGENPKGIPSNLMPYISQVAIKKLPKLKVFGDDYDTPDGTGVRDYIHIIDLAEGHLSALHFLSKKNGWHAFNLGNGKGYSVLEMVKEFENISGKKIPYEIVERRKGDVASSYTSTKKAQKILKWESKRNFEEMCFSAWKSQKFQRVHNFK